MPVTRRKFIRNTAVCGIATCFAGSGIAFADWPASSFNQENKSDLIGELFGQSEIMESSEIKIRAPEIAENGAVVPVSVNTSLKNVESVSLLVDKNPRPLAAQFILSGNSKSDISTRIKLAKESDIVAIVKADGKLYRSSKHIKVTIGGCGGGGSSE